MAIIIVLTCACISLVMLFRAAQVMVEGVVNNDKIVGFLIGTGMACCSLPFTAWALYFGMRI